MDRVTAKEDIKNREPDFLEPARQKINGHTSYICPSCGNGSGSSGDGIALDPHSKRGKRYKCFVCGLSEDVIGLWKLHTGQTDDKEAFKSLYEYYGLQVDTKPTAQEDFRTAQESFRESTKSKPKMNDTQKSIHTDGKTRKTIALPIWTFVSKVLSLLLISCLGLSWASLDFSWKRIHL